VRRQRAMSAPDGSARVHRDGQWYRCRANLGARVFDDDDDDAADPILITDHAPTLSRIRSCDAGVHRWSCFPEHVDWRGRSGSLFRIQMSSVYMYFVHKVMNGLLSHPDARLVSSLQTLETSKLPLRYSPLASSECPSSARSIITHILSDDYERH
jgi:hypothetical protein